MINLEQVRLLEGKVAKAVGYIEKVAGENAALLQREAEMQGRLASYQKRIDELEVLIMRFKEEQSQIEGSILAALNKLSQFEEAMEKSLIGAKASVVGAAGAGKSKAAAKPVSEPPAGNTAAETASSGEDICFEIPESDVNNDIDPLGGDDLLEDILSEDTQTDPPAKDGELDIF